MSTAPDSITPACPVCSGQVVSDSRNCPQCGTPLNSSPGSRVGRIEPGEDDWEYPRARRRDYVITAFVGLLAAALTFPASVAVITTAFLRGNLGKASTDSILALAFWNLWIWGPPVVYSALQYRAAVLAGVHHHSHLIRSFGRVLALSAGVPAGILTACAVLFFAICGRWPP